MFPRILLACGGAAPISTSRITPPPRAVANETTVTPKKSKFSENCSERTFSRKRGRSCKVDDKEQPVRLILHAVFGVTESGRLASVANESEGVAITSLAVLKPLPYSPRVRWVMRYKFAAIVLRLSRAAASVRLMSSSLWAEETSRASNCEGGKSTPRQSIS